MISSTNTPQNEAHSVPITACVRKCATHDIRVSDFKESSKADAMLSEKSE